MNHLIEEAKKLKTCLFFSGGLDSLVLLHLVKDENFPVVTFAEDFTKEQMKELEKIIFDYGLTLYTFPPKARYIVPRGDGLSLVDEYGFAGETIPVVRDVEDSGSDCLADLSPRRFDNFDFGFDCVLTGALKEDFHALTGNPMSKVKQQGNLTFFCPLWDWTKAEVEARAAEMSLIPIEATGEIKCCSKCLFSPTYCPKEQKRIPQIEWNPARNLQIFRERFNYEVI